MRLILAACLAMAGAITGCSTLSDARGTSEFCEIHHAMMFSIEVPAPSPSFEPKPDYLEARNRLFPHGFPKYPPDNRRKWVVFVCDYCTRAEADWKAHHGSN